MVQDDDVARGVPVLRDEEAVGGLGDLLLARAEDPGHARLLAERPFEP